jgi:hypothetical protein
LHGVASAGGVFGSSGLGFKIYGQGHTGAEALTVPDIA